MSSKKVLIYGGKGGLGSKCVEYFKGRGFWVGSIDCKANEDADASIIVNPGDSLELQHEAILKELPGLMGQDKCEALLCVAGGWAGGNCSSKDFIKNVDLCLKQSIWTSSIAASIASSYLSENGLLTFCGANAALEGTPGMVGYGFSKAAVHHLVKSLACDKSGLPESSCAVAILPVTLDTPMNRKWMPKADHSTWTPLEFIAELFYNWTINKDRPKTGSLVSLLTKEGKTDLKMS